MAKIYPFRALRPQSDLAELVASVPYDVVNRGEAKELASGCPQSFLHVTKPEIDMPTDVDVYSDQVYARGRSKLDEFVESGTLFREATEHLYLYALTMNGKRQTGVVMCASIEEYDRNDLKKHEFTRPDKEDDRVRHMEILGAQSGTVFLVHRDTEQLNALVASLSSGPAKVDFVASDGVRHQIWDVGDESSIEALVKAFGESGSLYIADGHHRSAAASRVAKTRGIQNGGFLAVSFPISEIEILPYNRLVKDLHGHSVESFLDAIGSAFEITQGKPEHLVKQSFAMYLGKQWYGLKPKSLGTRDGDPVLSLDVSILQDLLLEPILGIDDPRRNKRIEFVGGIRGDGELVKRVDANGGVAFSLFPTSIEELLRIADTNEVMPPKSTWFEPKLRDGLFVHLLD